MTRVINYRLIVKASLLLIGMTMAVTAVSQTTSDDRIHGEFSRTLKVAGKVILSLKNPNGEISVRVGSDDEVQIHSEISAGTKSDCDRASSARKVRTFEDHHAVNQQGNTIRIGDWAEAEMGHCTLINYEIQCWGCSRG